MAKAPAQSNPNGRGPAGRTTYCHSTRSATNPFVTITTSDNALPQAHEQHHDGDDIIPAPSGGCPGDTPPTKRPVEGGGPGGGGGLGAASGLGDEGAPDDDDGRGPADSGIVGVEGADNPAGADGPVADSDTLGESETSPGGGATAPTPIAEERALRNGALPFTGRSPLAILVAALLALAVGLLARRAAGRAGT